jgi:hypothetical protein
VAYWIKIVYDRETYAINLDAIGAFSLSSNKKINFWLPDGNIPICIHSQSNPESYQEVFDYIEKIQLKEEKNVYWIKFNYDRADYLIDLNQITAFSQDSNSARISFWLPDSGDRIILHPQSDFEAYSRVKHYIEKKIGDSLAEKNN